MSAHKKKERVDPAALALLSNQVRHFLAFHQEMGIASYPALPELRQFLTRVQQPSQSAPFVGKQGQQQQTQFTPSASSPMRQKKKVEKIPIQPVTESAQQSVQQELALFNQELDQCRCCASDAEPKIIRGQGSSAPRLLIVGDCFVGTAWKKGLFWGEEEDAMLWRMIQAIGLERKDVYVTNAIKCPQPAASGQPAAALEQSCFSHLEKELQIIRPKLICAMGDAACQALLKTKAPLARLRGRFHTYKYPHGGIGKVMPTFHPRLLVQHPEMKQATWKDLQAVQRALQTAQSASPRY